jgi:hypothetical protein
MGGPPFRVFYSYSHRDVRMLERLRNHMAMLRRRELITEWYDREVEAGSRWRNEIERERWRCSTGSRIPSNESCSETRC